MRRPRGTHAVSFPSLDCTNEYFEILDGPPSSAKALGRACYGYYLTYASSSRTMTVKYFRSFNSIGKIFIAYYYSATKGKNGGEDRGPGAGLSAGGPFQSHRRSRTSGERPAALCPAPALWGGR